ncbi:hypothetical protein [Methylocaldum szegediense]|uniref:Uncharacterized protein n=1 Tax=Methylocaldum szegediense TaxID=73780 RepID=A0ABM9I686_9GAMM|nr:hypothetical protein [Methylocaldum szegediense]CAI8918905.1 protein of unknown function [Methylocaldum szegediense]
MSTTETTTTIATQEALDAFNDAQAEFLEWRSKLNALQTRAEQQQALAKESEAEAASHKEAIDKLIRDESVDKAKLHELTAKHKAALSLAEQYLAFADELLQEKEKHRPYAMLAAERYYSSWERAVSSVVDSEVSLILDDIRDRLLRAVKLKELALKMAQRMVKTGITSDAYGRDNLTDLAFGEIKRHLAKSLEGFNLDLGSGGALALLERKPDIRPFTRSEIKNPMTIVKLRQDLARKQCEAQRA